jgi:hypothetical protein
MSAQQELLKKYGDPDSHYLWDFCHVWQIQNDFSWFPVKCFLVNDDFKDILLQAFKSLEDKGLHVEIKTYDGCYNDRSVRGSTITSLHAWGCAIDLNAAEEGMQSIPAEQITPEKRLGKWSQAFVDTMKTAGLYYGGDFHSVHADGTERIDPMHWALLDG